MTVKKLRELSIQLGIDKRGKKQILIDRIIDILSDRIRDWNGLDEGREEEAEFRKMLRIIQENRLDDFLLLIFQSE